MSNPVVEEERKYKQEPVPRKPYCPYFSIVQRKFFYCFESKRMCALWDEEKKRCGGMCNG
jgi:hypothetical protein